MYAEVKFVTPTLAKAWLKTSLGNRKLSEHDVSKYVRDLQSGEFQLTHQGIAFDTDGHLFDGHHRLTAIARSGIGAQMLVAYDCSKESKIDVDTGRKRNTNQVIMFNGIFKDSPAQRNSKSIACLNSVVYNTRGYRGYSLSSSETISLLTFFEKEIEAIYNAETVRDGRCDATVAGAALAALIKGESAQDIYDFMSVYKQADIRGSEDKNYQCVIGFKRMLEDLKYRGRKLEKSKKYNMAQNCIYNFINKTKTKTIKETDTLRYDCKKELDAFFNEYRNGWSNESKT